MKTLKYISLVIISGLLLSGCEKIEFLNLKRNNPLDGKNVDEPVAQGEYPSVVQEEDSSNLKPVVFDMVFVQGGTFSMGCTSEQGSGYNDEYPVHQVTLSDFYIGKYEVTQAQWKAIMGNNPSYFKGDNLPIEYISWDDVQEFIQKLNARTGKNYRLPTEAEWEYAARGGSQSRGYMYSGSNNAEEVAWYRYHSEENTHLVGTKKANELGIYDMSGNVWEWCNDWYGNYGSSMQINPVGASSGSYRVNRGGSWDSYGARYCRVAVRSYDLQGDRHYSVGFRVACSSE
jgi:formylglycine-generating enzyme required for sulfatase activity